MSLKKRTSRATQRVLEPLESRRMLSFTSDDFNATSLDPRWTLVDPVGGGSALLNGTNAILSVPGGIDHDVWAAGNRSVRIMQAAVDENFELEVKFESIPTARYQLEGLIVEASPGNYLRLDYFHDGGALRLFAASFANNSPTIRYNDAAAVGWNDTSTLYMRVRQQGDQWTQSYSYDGSTWTTAANFSYALGVTQVGVFAANGLGGSSPAFTASVDYFFNTASPVDPEDADFALDTTAPLISRIRNTVTTTATQIKWHTNELSRGQVQYGLTTAYELGSVGLDDYATSHWVTLDNLVPGQTYHCRVVATNQNGLTTQSPDRVFVAGNPAEQGPTVNVWYGNQQSFGQLGNAQRWVNVLGRVADLDGISSLRYSLNGGVERALSWGPTALRLEAAGDFNVEIDRAELLAGTNVVRIFASDNVGNTTTSTVNVTYTANQVWPRTYVADWSTASKIGDVAQVVDGFWSLQPGGVRSSETGYDRTIAIGDVTWQDYEVVVPITIHSMNANGGSGPPGVGIIARWAGHYDGWDGQPRTKWWPLGALGWYHGNQLEIIGNDQAPIAAKPMTLVTGTPYLFKMRVETPSAGGQSIYSLKVWAQGSAEPAAWDLTGTGVAGELARGSVLLTAHHTDATYGNVTVTPLADLPPTILNVQTQPRATEAQVTWQTNEPATAIVEYGLTTNYELGSVAQPTLGANHAATLDDLSPQTTYHFRIRATDGAGNVTTSPDFTVTTPATDPPVFTSDDFSNGIDTGRWTFVNPRGDGSATTDGTRALISVGAGQDHDVWSGANNAARLMQPALNEDFEFEVKFESQPTKQYQLQGAIVETSPGNYLRFDFFHDGATLRVFAASFANNSPTVRYSQAINPAAAGGALFMRVRRQGNQWTQSYSYNGTTWLAAANFSHAMAVNQVGMFAGNAGGAAAPAYTAVVDYFFNTASPISPEDNLPPDTTPPLVQSVQSDPHATQAQVTWQTNEPTTAIVEYGLTTAYALGSVPQSTPGTSHAVTLLNLQPSTTYHFRIRATDAAGNVTTTGDFTLTTSAADPPAFASDDFSAGINPGRWTFVNPRGDGSATTDGTRALISVGDGQDHDVWNGANNAARLMEAAANQDFELEVKFESQPTQAYQLQGVIVETSPGNYLRFDFYHDGATLRVFAASFVSNGATVRHSQGIAAAPAGGALYMRVGRQGNQWTQSYSYNGTTWFAAASFSHAMTVNQIGVFAGNAGGTSAPAYTAVVDYFFNTASPINPEDNVPPDTTPPLVQNVQNEPRATQAQVTWQTNEPATAVLEYGLTLGYELGSVAQPTLGANHAVTLAGLQAQTTYHFRIRATDAAGNVTTSGDFTVTTAAADPPAFDSDDFSAGIDPGQWTFVNPRGDGSATTDDTRALISVAAGQDHDVWNGANNAARLMQASADQDFELEVKFQSQPTKAYQLQGVIVEASPGNYLRFDFYHDGATLHLFAASFVNNGATVRHAQAIGTAPAGELYMRIRRVGNQWTQSYSYNGTTWSTAATFAHTLAVSTVGVFAGNAGGATAPAYTAVVDYFFNTASPIDPEDDVPPDATPPLVQSVQSDPRAAQAQVTWQTNEPATAIVEYGLTTNYERGSVGQPALAMSHAVTLLNLAAQTTYHFRIRATDAAGNVTTSPDFAVTTAAADPPAFDSDDFSAGTLSPIWSLQGPGGSATLGSAGDEKYLELTVPAGNFDPWFVNRAVRLMQNAANADFGLEVGFLTTPGESHEMQGVIVEQDANNWLRFDVLSDGTKLYLFAATTVNGGSSSRFMIPVAAAADVRYLRVQRTGNTWTFARSADGVNWTTAATFAHAMNVTAVGPFAGATPSAAGYVARVDYFENSADPIANEDGINAIPVARGDAYPVAVGQTITVDADSGVLANDTDGDGDPLTASLVSGPAEGTLTFNSDGSFIYTAGAGFDGEDGFVYSVSDTAGHTVTASVLLKDAVMFATHVADTTMGLTHFSVPADFDGDGDLDLVSTSEATHMVAWYENDGALNFAKHVIDSDLNSAYPVSVADLDRDGDVDVLVGGYRADKYVWYENNGSGAFTRRDIGTKDGPHSILAVDMDDDGDLDLVTASQDSNTIAWYENNGSQNFSEHVIDAGVLAAKSALPADMDGDGDVDIVTASFGDDTIAWYRNDGGGNFAEQVIDTTADGAYYAMASDIDGDGDQDIISASQLNARVAWYRNDGAAGFVRVNIDTNALGARAVYAADVDGDGRTDILAASVDDNTLAWHRNNGDGTFTKNLVANVAGAYGVYVVDMDGDGLMDVLSAGRNDGSVSVHRQVSFVTSPASSSQQNPDEDEDDTLLL